MKNFISSLLPFGKILLHIVELFDLFLIYGIHDQPDYEEAYQLIEEGIGSQFDPIIAQEFLKIKDKAAAINERYKYNT